MDANTKKISDTHNNQLFYIITIIVLVIIIVSISTICIINNKKNRQEISKMKNQIILNTRKKKEEKTSNVIREIIKNENIVFLGDSITYLLPVDDIFDNMPAINSGIAGYKTRDILDNMYDLVYKFNPTKVFVLIGINDYIFMDENNSEEEITERIIEIMKEIEKNRPKAKLYLESIYPINKELGKWKKDINNDTINNINKEIKKYAEDNNITYIDVFGELVDESNNLKKQYTDDGLHPSSNGYIKITSILMPYVLEK